MKISISKCCLAKIDYVKDPGNHHDECNKCGKWLKDEEVLPFYQCRECKYGFEGSCEGCHLLNEQVKNQ